MTFKQLMSISLNSVNIKENNTEYKSNKIIYLKKKYKIVL